MTIPKELSSLQHPLVKKFVKLRTSRKMREEQRRVVVSGKKLVEEFQGVETLLVKKGFSYATSANEVIFVTDPILKKITGLEAPEPIAAIVPMPKWQSLQGKGKILGLDGIADPGNLGTLLRTSLSLGWEGIFLTDSCVDPFNDKALRAAKGATFRTCLQKGSIEEMIELGKNLTTLIANMEGEPLEKVEKLEMLILGNEAQGVNPLLKKAFPSISIPIQNIESLNVAVAGGIILYQFRP